MFTLIVAGNRDQAAAYAKAHEVEEMDQWAWRYVQSPADLTVAPEIVQRAGGTKVVWVGSWYRKPWDEVEALRQSLIGLGGRGALPAEMLGLD